jgi:hypothetical protein
MLPLAKCVIKKTPTSHRKECDLAERELTVCGDNSCCPRAFVSEDGQTVRIKDDLGGEVMVPASWAKKFQQVTI